MYSLFIQQIYIDHRYWTRFYCRNDGCSPRWNSGWHWEAIYPANKQHIQSLSLLLLELILMFSQGDGYCFIAFLPCIHLLASSLKVDLALWNSFLSLAGPEALLIEGAGETLQKERVLLHSPSMLAGRGLLQTSRFLQHPAPAVPGSQQLGKFFSITSCETFSHEQLSQVL